MSRRVNLLAGALIGITAMLPGFSVAQQSIQGSHPSVFVMTNSAERNEVIAFSLQEDGRLLQSGEFNTGGRGTGGVTDPLESQGSLTTSGDRRFLFAVNGGSGDVTVFRIAGPELTRADRVASGGSFPNAVAQHGDLVYVLNSGGGSNVTGFHLSGNGKLTRINGGTTRLSANVARGGSLAFSPDGSLLIVTEKQTNQIDAFRVNADGTLGSLVATPSAGPGGFAAVFAPNGEVITSETGAGAGDSKLSSYSVAPDLHLQPLSVEVPTNGTATCWQVVSPNGKFVYSSNSGSASISVFSIGVDGKLTPVAGTVDVTLPHGAANLDVAISSDGRYFYALESGAGVVQVFRIGDDGLLTPLSEAPVKANVGFSGISAL